MPGEDDKENKAIIYPSNRWKPENDQINTWRMIYDIIRRMNGKPTLLVPESLFPVKDVLAFKHPYFLHPKRRDTPLLLGFSLVFSILPPTFFFLFLFTVFSKLSFPVNPSDLLPAALSVVSSSRLQNAHPVVRKNIYIIK